jgi:regulator of sigma E protease
MAFASLPSTLLAFLFAIAVLVVIHEFGHYWVARRCGVRVLRFSLGFGKPIWSRTDRHGTEWSLAPIPLGGYVSMLDEREAPVPERFRHEAFNTRPVSQRIAIVLAGPMANLLLAVLLYMGLAMVGGTLRIPYLAEPAQGSPAALAGLRGGERVVAVGSRETPGWTDVRWQLMRQLADEPEFIQLAVESSSTERRSVTLSTQALRVGEITGDLPRALGLALEPPAVQTVIEHVAPDGAGARAGFRPGDRVMAVAGTAVTGWEVFASTVRANPGRDLMVTVERDDARLDLRVTPSADPRGGETVGRVGLGPRPDDAWTAVNTTAHRSGFTDALADAVARTWDTSVFSLQMLGGMLTGAVSPANLSGPVAIADFAGQSARMGWVSFVGFLALMSISLGVLNLLPVPVLDGGHIMYHLAEAVTGRPVPVRVMEIGQRIGMAALAAMMLVAFYNDIQRLLTG